MSDYPLSTKQLDGLRHKTDPPAELVVDQLFKHYNLTEIDFLFRQIPKHIENDDFPEFLKEFMVSIGSLPEWLDREKVKVGQQIFWDYGREVILSFLCRSLPMCYIIGNGAQVLTTTARLVDFPRNAMYTRRLLETLQLVINVCSDESRLGKAGVGVTTVKKVRLIHATIRRYIHEKEDWPTEKFGEPINQEDLLITMSAFNIEVVKAMEKMGIHLSLEEKEAWSHLWTVVGFLLGIEEQLLPKSYAAFNEMSQKIMASQAKKTDSGILLVDSCIEFMSGALPFHLLDSFSYSVFKYLNKEEHRQQMGLTKTHWFWDWLMPKLMKTTLGIDQKLEQRSFILKCLINHLNKGLMRFLSNVVMKNEKEFYLPPSLKN